MTAQQFPEGWQMVKFGDIAKHISKRVEPSETDLDIYVGLEHLDSDSLKIKRHGVPGDVAGQKLLVKKGQIIFGKRRAYQRKVAVADWDCICSAHAMVLEANPDKIIPEFLPFFMQSDTFMNRAVAISEGSLSPTIKWKSLEIQAFQIPSKIKQKEIVEILNRSRICQELGLELSAAKNRLEQTLLIDAIYRKSYQLKKLGDVSEILDPNPSHRYPESKSEGIPFLSTENFEGRDNFAIDDAGYVSDEVFIAQNERCQYLEKDIVFARKGKIGFARFYGKEAKAFSHTISLIKAKEKLIYPEFLLHMLRSVKTLHQINNIMNSNSGVPTLGLIALSNVQIPIPPLSEQVKIISAINSLNCIEFNLASNHSALAAAKKVILARE